MISKIFDFLPFDLIKVSQVKVGDVVNLHQFYWDVIVETNTFEEDYNHGFNQNLITLDSTCHYKKPSDSIKIIKRDLIDSVEIQKFIVAHLIEKEEQRKFDEEEEREELEREKEYLRERLRNLDS